MCFEHKVGIGKYGQRRPYPLQRYIAAVVEHILDCKFSVAWIIKVIDYIAYASPRGACELCTVHIGHRKADYTKYLKRLIVLFG